MCSGITVRRHSQKKSHANSTVRTRHEVHSGHSNVRLMSSTSCRVGSAGGGGGGEGEQSCCLSHNFSYEWSFRFSFKRKNLVLLLLPSLSSSFCGVVVLSHSAPCWVLVLSRVLLWGAVVFLPPHFRRCSSLPSSSFSFFRMVIISLLFFFGVVHTFAPSVERFCCLLLAFGWRSFPIQRKNPLQS